MEIRKNRITNYLFPLLLVIATALLYGRFLWNPLVFDDTNFFREGVLSQYGGSLFHFNLRWFPYASFGWTYYLFGMDWFWYRLGNLALHAATGILLFVFFSRLLAVTAQSRASEGSLPWPAFFGALIFVLHPAAVYGAAYLVERSIVMATLFGVASLLCYLEGLVREKNKWFAWAALFYFLAVFSKEHSIMIPGVAAAMTLLIHKPSFSLVRKLWLPFVLYLAIGLFIILRTKGLLGAAYEEFAAQMLARMSEQQSSVNVEHAYALSVITEGFLFFKYLFLWLVPYTGWMSVDLRQSFATGFASMPEAAGFVLFLAYPVLAGRLLLKGGRQGLLGFGLLFPWILFLTELAAVRIQEPFVLYRSYLWMSGLPIVLLAFRESVPGKAFPALGTALCLVLAVLAWNRLDTFSSNMKLWSDVVSKNSNEKLLGVERGYNNRGNALMEAGKLSEAENDFRKALALNPKFPNAYLNMGMLSLRRHQPEEALQSYSKALELKTGYTEELLNERGVTLLKMGRYNEALSDFSRLAQIAPGLAAQAYMNRGMVYAAMGEMDEAIKNLSEAMRRDPRLAGAYLNRALVYARQGKPREALNDLADAIRINPKSADAYMQRGIIDAMQGHAESALDDMAKAIRIAPENAEIYFNRGIVYGAMGRQQEAMKDYDKAIELDPNYADAYVNRGGLRLAAGRFPEALAEFDRAIQANPRQENAYTNRGNVFAAQSRFQEALREYDKAIELNPRSAALLNRGLVLLALHRNSEARESWRRACEAGNRNACERLR